MTAQIAATCTSWAVIDRPYSKGTVDDSSWCLIVGVTGGDLDHAPVRHDDFAIAIVDSNICKQKVLNGVIVPFVAGRALVMPLQLTGVRVDGDDGGNVEIVQLLRLPAAVTHVRRPDRPVTGSHASPSGFR